MQKLNILWVREDFRTEDNPALLSIEKDTEKFEVFYAYNSKNFESRSAQRWWLYKSLIKFQEKLSDKGIVFKIFNTDILTVIKELIKKNNINQFYFNKRYEPKEQAIETEVENYLNKNNIKVRKYSGNLLQNPFDVKKKDGTPFQVFTPYWRNAEEQYLKNFNFSKKISNFKSKKIDNNNQKILENFIKPKKNWYVKFEKYWEVGEDKAKYLLKEFIKNKINNYSTNRDIPSTEGTSKLSPYLAFGEISPQYIIDECYKISKKNIGFRKYINEIGWREFAHHLLNHFPQMEHGNLRKQFDKFKWEKNNKKLNNWKKGKTGYPIVDAGMRELYETGWMHNRVRMITASFLVKHLRINWIEGEKHFKDSLLDFNMPNNVAGWQWVAGCGADAAPYFRIFNPILQGEKFDPDGTYVKKWVSELRNVPNKYIHKPWELPKDIAEKINFNINRDYIAPIVNHEEARQMALKAFADLKK